MQIKGLMHELLENLLGGRDSWQSLTAVEREGHSAEGKHSDWTREVANQWSGCHRRQTPATPLAQERVLVVGEVGENASLFASWLISHAHICIVHQSTTIFH